MESAKQLQPFADDAAVNEGTSGASSDSSLNSISANEGGS